MIREKVAAKQSSQLTQGVIATLQLRNRNVAVATAMLPLKLHLSTGIEIYSRYPVPCWLQLIWATAD